MSASGVDFSQVSAKNKVTNPILLDNGLPAVANEGNIMTLLTLQQMYGQTPGSEEAKIIKATADKEMRYLFPAMKLLNGELPTNPEQEKAVQKLRDKLGQGLDASVRVANLVRAEMQDAEVRRMLMPVIGAASSIGGTQEDRDEWGAAVPGYYAVN